MKNVIKVVAEKWKNLDEEEKAVYHKKADEEFQRYAKEVEEYEAKYGPLQMKFLKMKSVGYDEDKYYKKKK